MCVLMWFYQTYAFCDGYFTEAIYDKQQTIKTYENQIAILQTKVEKLEATSAEKDALTAKYKATRKKSEG